MQQVVLYPQPTEAQLARQTHFNLERTQHEFDVVRLWEIPAEIFLQYPGLLPFAVLGQTSDSDKNNYTTKGYATAGGHTFQEINFA